MMGAPLVPPMQYDQSTGTWRAVEWSSAPLNLAWTLVIMLTFFGFGAHEMWIGAGVLAAVLAVVETVSRRRRHPNQPDPR